MNRIIIYGAGKEGKYCLEYMKWRKIDNLCECFVDKNYKILRVNKRDEELGKGIYDVSKILELKLPTIVAVGDEEEREGVIVSLSKMGVDAFCFDEFYKAIGERRNIHIRQHLAFVHAKYNDEYFRSAENDDSISVFWDEKSPFFHMFNMLDKRNIVELACGWGRHVSHYYNQAAKITLVDILQENIDICKNRFGHDPKITYCKNDGHSFGDLKENEYTAIFSYDAMVHFEMFDVYDYLCDTYRILAKGGMALFHHSNYADNPEKDFTSSDHARNFMSKDLFRYLTYRSGLEIVDQQVIDWCDNKDLDCISLVKKI